MLNFIISALATWRLSSLLVREDGPGDILAKLRSISGVRFDEMSRPYGTNIVSSALLCVWCVSIWVGAFIAILNKPVYIRTYLQNLLSLSASAVIIDEIVERINEKR